MTQIKTADERLKVFLSAEIRLKAREEYSGKFAELIGAEISELRARVAELEALENKYEALKCLIEDDRYPKEFKTSHSYQKFLLISVKPQGDKP